MLALWTFRSYIAPSGRDDVTDWYHEQGDAVQAAVDVAIEYLSQRPRNEWRRPHFDLLSGKKLKGIGEIRLDSDRVEYRILGWFGPNRPDFTLLIAASKKGKNYTPKSALATACKRRDALMQDGSRCRVFDC
jgi:hypothetical protein